MQRWKKKKDHSHSDSCTRASIKRKFHDVGDICISVSTKHKGVAEVRFTIVDVSLCN